MRKEGKVGNEFFNEMENPYGDDARQEPPRPPAGSTADQQGIPADAYQQGLPPAQGDYQQYTPPGQGGYQPYTRLVSILLIATSNRMVDHTCVTLAHSREHHWA